MRKTAPFARPYTISRRTLVLGLAAASTPVAGNAACRPVRVLFVCPAGTVKSPIAREALKRRAAAEGMSLAVSSRGVLPEDHLSAGLKGRLEADGLDPLSEPVRKLQRSDVARADVVVAFDAASKEPMLRSAQAWVTPSWNDDYAAAKADLDHRLSALMVEIRRRAFAC